MNERRTPDSELKRLDDKGRCCGRKPIVYKGGSYRSPGRERFCDRCDRSYDYDSGVQIENWAFDENGKSKKAGLLEE